ncbi:MAG: hypothetical protein JWL90_3787 [Chthoniobacteraceae bacterium]|nr:hypothetical protein [Chthoniobacteraceae bacterium]
MKLRHAIFPILIAASAYAQEKGPRKAATPAVEVRAAAPVAAPVEKAPPFDLTADTAPQEFAMRFFELLQKGDVDGAYDGLTKGSKIAAKPDEIKALKAKTREAIDVFGAVLGSQLCESKPVGERLLRRTYVSLGREFPLRWRFYFYKPDLTWRLVDLRVDDRLAGIFDEPDETRATDIKP